MKIFLLGLPGSGKTTLGKELSIAMGIRFVDLDEEIERGEKMKITEIFKDKGEPYFRQLESRELKKWCDASFGFVMATGGGAPCFEDNLTWINRSGKSVFLDVPVDVIAERIRLGGHSERPLLASLPPETLQAKISALREDRISFYSQAHVTLRGVADVDEVIRQFGNSEIR